MYMACSESWKVLLCDICKGKKTQHGFVMQSGTTSPIGGFLATSWPSLIRAVIVKDEVRFNKCLRFGKTILSRICVVYEYWNALK